jgi:hypothetical protein
MSDDDGIGRYLVGAVLLIVAVAIPVLALDLGARLLINHVSTEPRPPLIRYRPMPMPTWGNGPITIPLYTPRPGLFVRR